MSDSIFFSGRIEEAIQTTVANRKPLACFVTDESDDSNLWESDYFSDDTVSSSLKDSAITVRLLKDSNEANYLNAFCSITTYPTLLIIKNGGAGVDGLTVITNPISKEDFVAKISSTFSSIAAPPTSLMDGVNSSPNFPAATTTQADTATTATTVPTTSSSSPPPPPPPPQQHTAAPSSSSSTSDSLPANTQFPPESETGRRLASIQAQHRERIARLKAQREAAELEAQKKRELARREDTQAMAAAAETQKSRSNKQYADEQKKRKMEAEKERRRVLEQIKADREEMRIREANRKAIAAEAEAAEIAASSSASSSPACAASGKEVPKGGQCNLAFRLFDGSRISHKFSADATVEKDVRPWLDNNRTDSNHPYKLVVQSSSMSSKNIEGSSSLSELGLYPSAILILKPIASSKISSAFAPARRTGAVNNQQNFLIAFLLSIWLMIKTFLGLHNPSASVVVGEKKEKEKAKNSSNNNKKGERSGSGSSEDEDIITAASSGSITTPVVSRDVAKKRIRTLHDGEGDKRSAYYNGNQLDFEPKKKEGDEE
ncbi:hypothetical protein TWF730_001425 [Orbilia blumenaviensis]|uniref:UBX domain-containing protein 2 n=1 Tax=Orbilia blumenaviensis TaxID=1796055 RepID=A0AAV9UIK5_9PEZI